MNYRKKISALSEEEQEVYTAKKAAKDAEIQANTPTEGDDDAAEGGRACVK